MTLGSTMELPTKRASLQEAMNLLATLAGGIEEAVGRTANSVTYVAGKNLGRRFSEKARKTGDIVEALAEVQQVLESNNCLWMYETFRPKTQAGLVRKTEQGEEILLVFRDCMIRQSLFSFGHAQRGSLCNMMFGFFAGALERILQREANLEILHAGENACYKVLRVRSTVATTTSPKTGTLS